MQEHARACQALATECHLQTATVCLRVDAKNALNRRRPVLLFHQPTRVVPYPSAFPAPSSRHGLPSPARLHRGPATANCPRSRPHRAPRGPCGQPSSQAPSNASGPRGPACQLQEMWRVCHGSACFALVRHLPWVMRASRSPIALAAASS